MEENYLSVIRRVMLEKGITQGELAKRIGKTITTINNYLNGNSKMDVDTFIKITQILEKSPCYLLGLNCTTPITVPIADWKKITTDMNAYANLMKNEDFLNLVISDEEFIEELKKRNAFNNSYEWTKFLNEFDKLLNRTRNNYTVIRELVFILFGIEINKKTIKQLNFEFISNSIKNTDINDNQFLKERIIYMLLDIAKDIEENRLEFL